MHLIKRILNSINNRPRVSSGFFSNNMTIYVNNQILSVPRKGLNAKVVNDDNQEFSKPSVEISCASASANQASPEVKIIESLSPNQAERLVKKIYRANQPLHVRVLRFTALMTLFVIVLNSTPAKLPGVAVVAPQPAAVNAQLTQPLGLPSGPFTE